jgi:hypothetical protein
MAVLDMAIFLGGAEMLASIPGSSPGTGKMRRGVEMVNI